MIINKTAKNEERSYFFKRKYLVLIASFFLPQNACVSNLCKNQATCQTGFTAKGYRCLCIAGFKGEYCEIGEFLFLSNNVQSVFNQLYHYVESIILIASSKFARVDAKVWQRLIQYRPRINAALNQKIVALIPTKGFPRALTCRL